MPARERNSRLARSAGPVSRLWNSVAISCHPPNLFRGARAILRRRLHKSQMLGPGKTSSSRRKSITSASRSSCRNIPMQCGTFSGTSSTSRTGRQNRSRPLRNTQYCDSGGRSSMGPSASSKSPVSASAGRGSRWKSSLIACSLACKLSCEPPYRAKQVFSCKRLRHVAVRALLLAPILVARRILRGHQNHRNHVELRVALQVAANLKTVAVRHHHVEQDHAGPLVGYGFLGALRVVQPDRPIAFLLQQTLHQLDLRRRVVNDQDFFVHSRGFSILVHRGEVHVSSQLLRLAHRCVVLG